MNREDKENAAKVVRTVGIEDFKALENHISYMDDDIVIIDTLARETNPSEVIRLGCFLIGVCIGGSVEVNFNYKTYQLGPGDVLFGLPNSIIGRSTFSSNYKVRIAGFSGSFLQNILKMEKETWNTALYLHNSPVLRRGDMKKPATFDYLPQLLAVKIGDEPHCYHKEVIRHLFSAMFCELMGHLSREFKEQGNELFCPDKLNQAFHVSRKFAEMLAKDGGIHRSVSYYADALCYSSKHFSKLIKQGTGHTPLELINSRAMEHIKYRLKHSDKSIKEIAEEFNFPNQSFFGKFVKKYLGISPAKYRNGKEE